MDKSNSLASVAERPVLTKLMYYTLLDLHKELRDELEYKIYRRGGKNKPGSPARLLRRLGFKERRKDKLLKLLGIYLSVVEVV